MKYLYNNQKRSMSTMNKLAYLEGYLEKKAFYFRNSSAQDFISDSQLGGVYNEWRNSRALAGESASEKDFANLYNLHTKGGADRDVLAEASTSEEELSRCRVDYRTKRKKANAGLITAMAGAIIPSPLSIPLMAGGLGYDLYNSSGGSKRANAVDRQEMAIALKRAINKEKIDEK